MRHRLRNRLLAAAVGLVIALSLPVDAAPMAEGLVIAQAKKATPKRRILEVGPTRELKAPSDAAAIAKDGDHIRIDAGEYKDCAVWRQNRLLLEGVGGRPHVRDKTCMDQAIWLFMGSNIFVTNVEFSGALSSWKNGAGIKFVGTNLTVRDSSFHHNENGILTGRNLKSTIRIQNSGFRYNGKCEPDCAHGIYIGNVARLIVVNSIFQFQTVGHHIKSRALHSDIVGNRIEDGMEGTASFAIDLPNSGTAVIRDNYIQKGPKAENRLTTISIGEEGAKNPSQGIKIFGNSFLSSHPSLDSFVWNRTGARNVVVQGNRFLGKAGSKLKGPGQLLP